MDEQNIFYLGLFVMLLFITGVIYTIREFNTMEDQAKRGNYGKESVNIDKKKET